MSDDEFEAVLEVLEDRRSPAGREIERLHNRIASKEAEVKALRDMLRRSDLTPYGGRCWVCNEWGELNWDNSATTRRPPRHAPGCELAALLKEQT